MKTLFTSLLFITLLSLSYGQKTIRNIQVITTLNLPNYIHSISKYTGSVNAGYSTILIGDQQAYFNLKDTAELANLKRVTELGNIADILNRMNSLGWNLVAVTPLGYVSTFTYTFRKEYDISDFKKTEAN